MTLHGYFYLFVAERNAAKALRQAAAQVYIAPHGERQPVVVRHVDIENINISAGIKTCVLRGWLTRLDVTRPEYSCFVALDPLFVPTGAGWDVLRSYRINGLCLLCSVSSLFISIVMLLR